MHFFLTALFANFVTDKQGLSEGTRNSNITQFIDIKKNGKH